MNKENLYAKYVKEIADAVTYICEDKKIRSDFAKDVLKGLAYEAPKAFRKSLNIDFKSNIEEAIENLNKTKLSFEHLEKSIHLIGIEAKSAESKTSFRIQKKTDFILKISVMTDFLEELKTFFPYDIKKQKGPNTIVSDMIAVFLAKKYRKFFGKRPTFSKDHYVRRKTPFGRVCELVDKCFYDLGLSSTYKKIGEGSRKKAVDQVSDLVQKA